MRKGSFYLYLKKLIPGMVLLLFILFLSVGCAGRHLSENYGRSYEAILYAQAINPDAPDDRTPVDGCPGVVGELIYKNFKKNYGRKSFAEELGELIENSMEND